MICSIVGCDRRSITRISVLNVLFSYCGRHKKYIDKIILRIKKYKNDRKIRLSIYENETF